MNIAVLGMGYVGLTGGMAFAKHGFKTVCTTTTPMKAENLNKGVPPFLQTRTFIKKVQKYHRLYKADQMTIADIV